MEEKLKIAVQKKGRLNEESMRLIAEAGIKINKGSGKLVATARNFPIEILYLRDDDIPQSVAEGVADIGIVGENEVAEKEKQVEIVDRLGFSKCRLSLAIPKADNYNGLAYFEGKKIATSYPVILKQFLKKENINAEVHEISGSVEIAPGIGLADGIFDIVSSGSTLISNSLKEAEVVMKSEALMISGASLEKGSKKKILNDLMFRIKSVQAASVNKYILLNAPTENLEKIITAM